MKCPKCGYHSFESLDNCKKCGHDLIEHKAKYNLRGLTLPGTAVTAEAAATSAAVETGSVATVDADADESIDFGFDFLEEDEKQPGHNRGSVSLGDDDQEISLDQAFEVDSEAIPPAEDKDKPEKGPEFAF